ncbi:MAG: hypothetical protein ABEK50_03850 [bacterium]
MDKGNPGDPIQALVLGPSTLGVNVIKQLNKNSRFHITWAGKDAKATFDEREDELNVNRVIDKKKTSSPMTINELIDNWQPDIVFLCERGEDWDIENQVGSTNLERSMLDESLRIGDAPIITVSVEQGHEM